MGVIAIIAVQFLQSSVVGSTGKTGGDPVNAAINRLSQSGPASVLYVLALAALYKFTNKYTAILLLACAAVAGQFIFV